ncbi:MAG: oxidoreductase [Myxococcota bacterium]|nr:oxidoreductase [Myxococcota bacterium]
MADTPWTPDQIPALGGREIVVTGGNSGIGFESALALARAGARVTLACRSLEKARDASARIRDRVPEARVEEVELDLASLSSIRKCADALLAARPTLHVLLNNAGVMAIPYRRTADGFEMQLGTNHLGHFALTGLLLERLLETPGARVVNVSSMAHRFGRIRWNDLQSERSYLGWAAYGQSKLANLLFTHELQRRLAARGADAIAVAAHPGYAATNLQFQEARMRGSSTREQFWRVINGLFSQSAEMGALPLLRAAAGEDVKGGEYYGPNRFENWGHPIRVGTSRSARNEADARRLWQISEELTGVRFDALAS